MITPAALKRGDKVAIISPATIVKPEYIDGGAAQLRRRGFEPVIMPHAKGPACGSYAASDTDRLNDLIEAYADPDVRAILCARGGYGCNHLLPKLPEGIFTQDPKWLIGFSDISALHAASIRAGVKSLHAPMAKHLTELPDDHYCTEALFRILCDGLPIEYMVPTHPLSVQGYAEGILVGGNLAVLSGLAATPYDIFKMAEDKDVILLIEDISEAIYAVERMLIRLRLSGALGKVKGIIAGSFTEYKSDRNFVTMEEMMSRVFAGLDIPVAYGFPCGHTDDNLPMPLGSRAILTVATDTTILSCE